MLDISALHNRHKGDTAHIVGMGPSLLNLRPEDFGPGPIVCCYESIVLIENWNLPNATYSLQKDDILVMPKRSPLLVHSWESCRQHKKYGDWPTYVFDTSIDFGNEFTNTSFTSVSVALLLGCRKIKIFCFDMSTHGDATRAILVDGKFVEDHIVDPLLTNETNTLQTLVHKFNGECVFITPQKESVCQ